MTFKIPFDSLIYKEQNKLHFDFTWSKILKQRRQHLITGIIMILLGVAIIIGKNNMGYLFIGFGLLALMFAYRLNDHYKKNKKIFFETIDKNITINLEQNQMSLWELSEDYFRYKDFKQDSKLQWNAFSGYSKAADTIFINSNVGICFILSQSEIGNENFNKVINILETKLNKTSG